MLPTSIGRGTRSGIRKKQSGYDPAQLHRVDEAESQFQLPLESRPDMAGAHDRCGNLLHDQGRYREAVKHHRKAIELKPVFAQGHTNLGRACET